MSESIGAAPDLDGSLPLPFTLRYELTRRQRLIPHLKIWWPFAPFMITCSAGALLGVAYGSWWLLGALAFFLFLVRGFFVGLFDVIVVPRRPVDLVVERKGLGFLAGKERWFLMLDGLIGFDEFTPGVWTLRHWNGTVINIPGPLLDQEQVAFFRGWVDEANAIRKRLGMGNSAAI